MPLAHACLACPVLPTQPLAGVTLLKLVLLVLITIVGFTQANGAQMTPFLQPEFGACCVGHGVLLDWQILAVTSTAQRARACSPFGVCVQSSCRACSLMPAGVPARLLGGADYYTGRSHTTGWHCSGWCASVHNDRPAPTRCTSQGLTACGLELPCSSSSTLGSAPWAQLQRRWVRSCALVGKVVGISQQKGGNF